MATLQRTTDNKFAMICLRCEKDKVNFEIKSRTRNVYGELQTSNVITFKCLDSECENTWSEEY